MTNIGDSAFSGCSGATDLTLGNNVTYIGNNSFYLCINITIIIIPDSVVEIGASAFEGCTGATGITVGNGVTNIGSSAFAGCSGAVDLTLGNNVTYIGDNSFYLCIKITIIVIPGSVKEIGNNSFKGCTSATKITVGNGVTKIGDSAFSDCTNATDVTLGNNVTYIGSNAFYMCVNITVIVMPEGMSYVGNNAFGGCTSIYVFMKLDKIPENWDEFWLGIEKELYEKVYANGEWEYSGSKPVIWSDEWIVHREATCTESGIKRLYAKNDPSIYKTRVISATGHNFVDGICENCKITYSGGMVYTLSQDGTYYTLTSLGECTDVDIIIADNIGGIPVTVIGERAFQNNDKIKSVEIPDTVTDIEARAFYGCSSIEKLVIGKGVKNIKEIAFFGLSSLKELYFNAISVESVSSYYTNYIGNAYPFEEMGSECEGTDVVFGASVVKIPANLFHDYNTNDLTAPINIKSIRFEVGSVCETIGRYAFAGCRGITEFIIPESVTTIEMYAFSGCSGLVSIYVPDSVTKIESAAFSACTSLISINLPFVGSSADANSNSALFGYIFGNASGSSVKVRQEYLGSGGSVHYADFTIPGSIKEVTIRGDRVSYGAFMNCTMLETVVLSEKITVVPKMLFSGCASLSIVKLNGAVTEIGEKAFYNCKTMVKLELSEAVTTIGDSAFIGMSSLESINIGASCKSYRTIDGVLYSADGKTLIYYPEGRDASSFAIPEGVEVIGANAFKGNRWLKSVSFPSTLVEIGASAFSGTKLSGRLVLPDSLNVIGERAFENCESLTYINLPNGLTTLSKYAFYNCTGLTEIYYEASNITDLKSNNYVFTNAGKNTKGITFTVSREVTAISQYLFAHSVVSSPSATDLAGSPNVTAIIFEDGSQCKTVGAGAFAYLLNLNYVYFAAVEMDDFASASHGVFAAAGTAGDGIRFFIQKDVKKIPAYLFYTSSNSYSDKSSNVISIEFEQGSVCNSIGAYAFMENKGLKTLTIPEHIEHIGNSAFAKCVGLTEIYYYAPAIADYTSTSAVFSVVGNESGGVKLTIGKNVTRIPAYMFGYKPTSNNSYSAYNNITSIIIEDGSVCSEIGAYAFAGCTNVSYFYYGITAMADFTYTNAYRFSALGQSAPGGVTFVVGKSVTRIPAYMMYGNKGVNITSIVFEGNACEYIGNYAFQNAFTGTSLTIPEFVTYLGFNSFASANNVTELIFNANVTTEYNANARAFYGLGSKGEGVKVTIGKNVTKIPAYMFATYSAVNNDAITNIVILDFEDGSVCTEIKENAFYNCTTLKILEYPKNLTNIESGAFTNCTNIEEYLVDEGGIYTVIDGNLYSADKKTLVRYAVAKPAEHFDIPEFVECVGASAFMYAKNLKTIGIGENVTVIERYAFSSCTSLEKISLGKHITAIGNGAFSQCEALVEIYYDIPSLEDFARKNYVFYYAGTAGEGIKVIFGENVERIPSYLFAPYHHPGMSTVTDDVPKITSLEFKGTALTEIGEAAFYWCKYITEIDIPSSITTIGKYAFAYCQAATKVNVHGSVTTIGEHAFSDCDALYDLTLGEGITELPDYMFSHCDSLAEINIPKSVTQIGNFAFRYTPIRSITIPENVTKIGSSFVEYCKYLTKINYNATDVKNTAFYIFSYAGQEGEGIELVIGNNVKQLPSHIFGPYKNDSKQSPKIVSVVFEEGSVCEKIGTGAFYYCVTLESIVIPVSVKEISIDAFMYCNNLKTVYYGGTQAQFEALQTNVATGNNAFKNATVYYYLDSDPTCEGDFWHYDENGNISVWPEWEMQTVGLEYEFVENGGDSYYVVRGMGTATDTDIIIPSRYKGIPVLVIGESAFSGCSTITSFDIPSSVIRIDRAAFSGCSSLTSITIPDGVIEISEFLFNGCYNLKNVKIPDSVKSIGFNAFWYCVKLETITLPYGVSFIGDCAFLSCTALKTVILPSSITKISNSVFSNCTSLTNIYYDGSESDFAKVSSSDFCFDYLYCYSESKPETEGMYWHYDDEGFPIAWPETVSYSKGLAYQFTSNGSSSFYTVTGIGSCTDTNIIIPPKYGIYPVSTIGYQAFYKLKNIKSVTIPDSVTSIGSYAFAECTGINSVNFGKGLIIIGAYAFNGCSSIQEITIPDGVTNIGEYAFQECTGASEVTLSKNMKSVATGTFSRCTRMRVLNIPDGIERIGDYAFSLAYSLTGVVIPNSVTSIGKGAFNTPELQKMYYMGSAEQFSSVYVGDLNVILTTATVYYYTESAPTVEGKFWYYDENGNVSIWPEYVPLVDSVGLDIFVSTYNGITGAIVRGMGTCTDPNVVIPSTYEGYPVFLINEKAFATRDDITSVVIPDSVMYVFKGAFEECSNLKSVTLSKNITAIDEGVFFGCYALTDITIPSGVTKIGKKAFYACRSLVSIGIPEGVTSIGNAAFYACSSLKGIKIPNTVTTMMPSIFAYCENLTTITIPDSVTSIEANTFYECRALETVTLGRGIKSIGEWAFYFCTSLKSIEFYTGLTTISSGAFYGCSALENVYYMGTQAEWSRISISSSNDNLTKANITYSYKPE